MHLLGVGCGVLQVDDRGPLLVLDVDGLGGVLCQISVLGDHHRHRFADVVDLAGGQERPQLSDRHLRDQGAEVGDVVVGEHGDDPGHVGCLGGVEGGDLRPGHR